MQIGLDFNLVEDLVAGVDEVGRGPLCGAVVTAAVILDPNRPIAGLNDSKKLTEARREKLFDEIREKALSWCIARAEVEEIDELNILHATMLAMQRAVEGLSITPKRAMIDGNRCPKLAMPAEACSIMPCSSAWVSRRAASARRAASDVRSRADTEASSRRTVLRSDVLSELYGSPVDVIRTHGRIVVVGTPDDTHPHAGHDHTATGSPASRPPTRPTS